MTGSNRLDLAVKRLARRQWGVVTWEQLIDLGLTPKMIEHRASCGQLRRIGVGVFAVPLDDLSQEGRWMAAVLRCGTGAVLSHGDGGALWELRRPERGAVHVTVPTQDGRAVRGVRVHRSATIREEEKTSRRGIPVTSLSRTLTDLAAELRPRQLQAALRQAEGLHRLNLRVLAEELTPRRTSPRHARLLRTLSEWVPGIGLTESELEARFLELVVRTGLPRPKPQKRFGHRRLDFLFPDQATVVEVDGWDTHRGRIAFQEDRVRDRALQAEGYAVLRFTWSEVVGRSRAVADELSSFFARRGRVESVPLLPGRLD